MTQQAAASVVSSSLVVGDWEGVPEVLDEDGVVGGGDVELPEVDDVGLSLIALATSARTGEVRVGDVDDLVGERRLRTVPVFWMRSTSGTHAGSWDWLISTLTCSWSTLASAGWRSILAGDTWSNRAPTTHRWRRIREKSSDGAGAGIPERVIAVEVLDAGIDVAGRPTIVPSGSALQPMQTRSLTLIVTPPMALTSAAKPDRSMTTEWSIRSPSDLQPRHASR